MNDGRDPRLRPAGSGGIDAGEGKELLPIIHHGDSNADVFPQCQRNFIRMAKGIPLRQNIRMQTANIIHLIDTQLAAQGLSERKACLNAGLGVDAIRTMRRGHAPRITTLQKLAPVLGVSVETLIAALPAEAGTPQGASRSTMNLIVITVRGYVQAGRWREAIEWEPDSWYSITVPDKGKYPGIERFGLEVRGNSMNRLYPEGTTLICVRFYDIARPPQPGDKVICLRRDRYGEFEATVKEYQRDDQGRHILWPRSDDPEHQTPIILSDELPVATDQHALPSRVNAGPFSQAGLDDIIIAALVIQSVRDE